MEAYFCLQYVLKVEKMKNSLFILLIILVYGSLSAQDYYHRFYNFTEISRHLPWNFLIEEDDLLLKVGMDFCEIDGGVCTSLLRVAKDNGDMKDVAFIEIFSKFNKDALLRLEDNYYLLGNQFPFNNRPSIYIINDSLQVLDKIEIDVEADHFLFVEWSGMVEREESFYALANVLTNFGDKFGIISKFDASTFEHQENFFIGRQAKDGSIVYDIQKDNLDNIYVYSAEDTDIGSFQSNSNVIYKIDKNDEQSIVDTYADFHDLESHSFLVSDESNFVYSKLDSEIPTTLNTNQLLRGLNFEGDSLTDWFTEFPWEEPNEDVTNLEWRKYDVYDIAKTQSGDLLVCGTIEDTPDAPELGGPYTLEDVDENLPVYHAGFISRFTKYGELLWQRIFIFTNTTNPDVTEVGFEFRGDLLQVAEDKNGDIYGVGRKTTKRVSGSDIPPQDSVWVVKIDSNGCLDLADCGTEEILTSISRNATLDIDIPLSVHPNPVGDILYIQSTEPLESYAIHNTLGQLKKTGQLLGKNTIDMSRINTGIYFLTVYTKDQKFKTQKIIKN